MVARKGKRTIASVPDLICLLDGEHATAVTTERLRHAQRVSAIGIPAPEIMRTGKAVRVWGPEALGYSEDFAPLESRVPDFYKKHRVPRGKEKFPAH